MKKLSVRISTAEEERSLPPLPTILFSHKKLTFSNALPMEVAVLDTSIRVIPDGRLLPANSLNHTRKSSRREGLFSFSWTLPSGGRSSASGSDLGRSSRGRAPTKYDSVYPIFRIAAQARNGLGQELRRGYSAAMSRL